MKYTVEFVTPSIRSVEIEASSVREEKSFVVFGNNSGDVVAMYRADSVKSVSSVRK